MDFEFINNLIAQLQGQNIFKYAFTGAKILAMAFLCFRFFETYLKNFENETPPIGSVLNILGYGLIIMSGDWIMTSIETLFAGVDSSMHTTTSDLYSDLFDNIWMESTTIFDGCEAWYDYIAAGCLGLISLVFLLVTAILAMLCKLADLSVTASYLLQRIFIIKFLQFVFPLALAFSTLNKMDNLFFGWIRRYIGVFLLGIAYIGIINFTGIVQTSLSTAFANEDIFPALSFMNFSFGTMIAVVVTVGIKIKLFQSVTSYILSFFS